ncbi:MAG: SIMPL domain-containing protein [Bacteroidota bacterium]|nr:SIMPL domain-containing protein [Bacteroidota bacterium]
MSNRYLIHSIILALALVLAGYFIGNTLLKSKKYERHVEVKGLAEREVQADLAVWPIQISLMGNDLRLLQKELDDQKKQVKIFFTSQGFSAEEFNAGVTNIQDMRADVYNPNARDFEFRFLAKTDFTIRTHDIEKLNNALSASQELLAKGILVSSKNTWQPVEYIFTGLNDIKPSMVEEATRNAREVAEKFARDSGSQVGKIKSARQGIFSISDRDQNTPEIKKVRVVSTIEYFLKD